MGKSVLITAVAAMQSLLGADVTEALAARLLLSNRAYYSALGEIGIFGLVQYGFKMCLDDERLERYGKKGSSTPNRGVLEAISFSVDRRKRHLRWLDGVTLQQAIYRQLANKDDAGEGKRTHCSYISSPLDKHIPTSAANPLLTELHCNTLWLGDCKASIITCETLCRLNEMTSKAFNRSILMALLGNQIVLIFTTALVVGTKPAKVLGFFILSRGIWFWAAAYRARRKLLIFRMSGSREIWKTCESYERLLRCYPRPSDTSNNRPWEWLEYGKERSNYYSYCCRDKLQQNYVQGEALHRSSLLVPSVFPEEHNDDATSSGTTSMIELSRLESDHRCPSQREASSLQRPTEEEGSSQQSHSYCEPSILRIYRQRASPYKGEQVQNYVFCESAYRSIQGRSNVLLKKPLISIRSIGEGATWTETLLRLLDKLHYKLNMVSDFFNEVLLDVIVLPLSSIFLLSTYIWYIADIAERAQDGPWFNIIMWFYFQVFLFVLKAWKLFMRPDSCSIVLTGNEDKKFDMNINKRQLQGITASLLATGVIHSVDLDSAIFCTAALRLHSQSSLGRLIVTEKETKIGIISLWTNKLLKYTLQSEGPSTEDQSEQLDTGSSGCIDVLVAISRTQKGGTRETKEFLRFRDQCSILRRTSDPIALQRPQYFEPRLDDVRYDDDDCLYLYLGAEENDNGLARGTRFIGLIKDQESTQSAGEYCPQADDPSWSRCIAIRYVRDQDGRRTDEVEVFTVPERLQYVEWVRLYAGKDPVRLPNGLSVFGANELQVRDEGDLLWCLDKDF